MSTRGPVGRLFRRMLRKAGRDLVPYTRESHPLARRMHLLATARVDLVLDVGANAGQYGRSLRDAGYRGRIVSFEPMREAYAKLERETKGDPFWETRNFALGDFDGIAEINVSANSYSSSILEILPRHLQSAPVSRHAGRESISVHKVDTVIDTISVGSEAIFLKVDTQGYEKRVLAGASVSLNRIVGAQLELSLVPLYQGDALLGEMLKLMEDCGFVLMSLEPEFFDPETAQLLQVDGVFFRELRVRTQ